jgi:hypothetical protein
MNTFSSFCMAACLFMIFIGLASGVVSSLNIGGPPVFPDSPDINTTEAQKPFNLNLTETIWIAGMTIGSLATVALFGAFRQTNVAAIAIFSTVFWTSWGSILVIFHTGGFLDFAAGLAIIGMLTFGMSIMFIGAVVGMLAGNPWMK